MEYRIIDITWNYAPQRLQRTIAVRQDIDLVTFAYIIMNAFLESPANGFAFVQGKKAYGLGWDTQDSHFNEVLLHNSDYIDTLGFADLEDTFTFIYNDDYDCSNWEFTCRKGKTINRKGKRYASMIDGKGLGIFAYAIDTLKLYIDGKLKPELTYEQLDDRGLDTPFNVRINQLKDFEKFDLSYAKKEFSESMDDTLPYYVEDYNNSLDYFSNDEYDEELDDDWMEEECGNTENLADSLIHLSLIGAFSQKESLDYVSETFNRLASKYDEETAFMMIAQTLAKNILELMQGTSSLAEEYKEQLKKLK